MAITTELLKTMWLAVAGESLEDDRVDFVGAGAAPSAFAATDFAAAAIATAGLAVAEVLELSGGRRAPITVDRPLASGWFQLSLRPLGWSPPPTWDSIAGDYESADGWIRLHTNAAHHRAAALSVLDCPADRELIAAAVRRLSAGALEQAVLAAGGCAAEMRSVAEWASHPQGSAVAAEPLVGWRPTSTGEDQEWMPDAARPLRGIRVLDLTRILAGPVATRFLAGYGAEVLRIDPPGWNETVIPEVTPGKRCATLDLKSDAGLAALSGLLAEADVVVHGYRPGALQALGLGEQERQQLRPGLVDISLDAYGWSGPWYTFRNPCQVAPSKPR